jgi:hypothetical protein
MLFAGVKTSDLLRRVYGSAGTLLNTILSRLEVPRRSSIDPSKLFNGSGSGRYIVVYRCQRSYVSSVIEPGDLSKIFGESASGLILDHHVAPPHASDKETAYYYVAIFNISWYI